MPALFLHRIRHRRGQRVGAGAGNRLVAEAADAIELGLAQPLEQKFELGIGFAGEADDERRANGQIRTDFAPAGDALQGFFLRGGTLHAFENGGRRVLEGHIEVRQELALGHQGNDRIDVWVRIDVVEAHPDAELAEGLGEVKKLRPHRAPAPFARGVFHIDAVGRRVLRDDQELLDAGGDQPLRFAQHVGCRPRHEIAPQPRNDAEAAAIVAAFGNLQIRVVPRRKLDAFRRHEIEEGVVPWRERAVHRRDHALVLLRPGHREHVRIGFGDLLRLGAHAAGDDDFAVLIERLPDRGQRFRLGAVEKTAGVDDHQIGAGVRPGKLVALGAQPRDDAFAVDQRLGAAERDEAHRGS